MLISVLKEVTDINVFIHKSQSKIIIFKFLKVCASPYSENYFFFVWANELRVIIMRLPPQLIHYSGQNLLNVNSSETERFVQKSHFELMVDAENSVTRISKRLQQCFQEMLGSVCI
jgi:CRISPR/Cas system-associated endoribonuclease Cas2